MPSIPIFIKNDFTFHDKGLRTVIPNHWEEIFILNCKSQLDVCSSDCSVIEQTDDYIVENDVDIQQQCMYKLPIHRGMFVLAYL